jgi:hypothetical protein
MDCASYCSNLSNPEKEPCMHDVVRKDPLLPQVDAILQENKVPESLRRQITSLRVGAGKVMRMTTIAIPTKQKTVYVSNNVSDQAVMFIFPPNKDEFIPEFQRAQNYGLSIYYTYHFGNPEDLTDPILRDLEIDSQYAIYPRVQPENDRFANQT